MMIIDHMVLVFSVMTEMVFNDGHAEGVCPDKSTFLLMIVLAVIIVMLVTIILKVMMMMVVTIILKVFRSTQCF